MNKFKIGDIARVNENALFANVPAIREAVGTVDRVSIIHKSHMVALTGHMYAYYPNELCKGIPDTKLARRLYKNNIQEIKDGIIWLK